MVLLNIRELNLSLMLIIYYQKQYYAFLSNNSHSSLKEMLL